MGQPVVHFEIVSPEDGKLREYYGTLFGWEFDAVPGGPTEYTTVDRAKNLNSDGIGIGGGIGSAPDGYDGHVTFYVEVPDVGAALEQAESLGGTRMMGPESPAEGIEIGLFQDPAGNTVGLVNGA